MTPSNIAKGDQGPAASAQADPNTSHVMVTSPPIPDFDIDTDTEMESVQEPAIQPPSHPPSTSQNLANTSSARFTIKAPGSGSYANALKRTAGQTEDDPEDDDDEPLNDNETIAEETVAPQWPKKATSGPIKGFSTGRVLENLDALVRETWESQATEAIFVHYLDGGYNPNIAQNVHAIADDLKSKHPST